MTNSGVLAINTGTTYNTKGAVLANTGAINIANGAQLTIANGVEFRNETGGKITGTGSGHILQTGGVFWQGPGTTSGTKPVIVDDATLRYPIFPAAGASAIALRGSSFVEGEIEHAFVVEGSA
jgi:hypothetical protein